MFGLKIMRKSLFEYVLDAKNKAETELDTATANLNQIRAHNNCLEELLKEANTINNMKANENGCVIGEWCAKCDYGKRMQSSHCYFDQTRSIFDKYQYVSIDVGYYCMKHMKDICPEFKHHKD